MTTGVLFDVKRFAVHDGPGVRTTFLLKGCPLRCRWCHNPEGISPAPELAYYAHRCIHCGECVAACPHGAHRLEGGKHAFERSRCVACGRCEEACLGGALRFWGRPMTVAEAVALALEDRPFYEQSGGGVTVSGGEPLLQPEFALELLAALRRQGLHTALDTCAAVPWAAIAQVLPFTDLLLIDLKQADTAAHRRLTGRGNQLILRNFRRLAEAGATIEVRMPLVPGSNDGPEDLAAAGAFLAPLGVVRVKVLPYHDLARSKYDAIGVEDTMPRVAAPTAADLDRAVAILRAAGAPAVASPGR